MGIFSFPATQGPQDRNNRMELPHFFDELLVVIVLYKRTAAESAAYTTVNSLLDNLAARPEIYIYDNSPSSCIVGNDSVTYCHDPANGGVSKAYNCACIHAQANGKSWLLLLDQDTSTTPEFFRRLATAVTADRESVAFVPRIMDVKGLLSPFRFSGGRGKRMLDTNERLSLDRYRFINSGLLIRVSAFISAGGYNPDIPLDFSDINFGWRLQKITGHFRAIDTPLRHAFSDNAGDANTAAARFRYFCQGAVFMGKESNHPFRYVWSAFLRACHLAYRYRDVAFIRIFLHYTIYG